MEDILFQISLWTLPILLAFTIPQAGRAWLADRAGDPTPRQAGRVTIDPLVHMHPIGSVVLPLALIVLQVPLLFGFGKPVPVHPENFKNPKSDFIKFCFAGPAANLALAFIATFIKIEVIKYGGAETGWLVSTLTLTVFFNTILAIFFMLPIPPLDGGMALLTILPPKYAIKFAGIERFGFLIILGIIILFPIVPQMILGVAMGIVNGFDLLWRGLLL